MIVGCLTAMIKNFRTYKKMQQIYQSTGEDAELLLNGIERHYGDDKNCWSGKIGDTVTFSFESEKAINEVRFVFNSDLNRETTGAGKYIPEK